MKLVAISLIIGGLAAGQTYAITPCTGGFAGAYPCSGIDLAANMSLNDMGATEGNDLWGWTDPGTGVEYALMGLDTCTAFVNISTPDAPVLVGLLPAQSAPSSWRDIKVYADHAYIVSEASLHGMQGFDLT